MFPDKSRKTPDATDLSRPFTEPTQPFLSKPYLHSQPTSDRSKITGHQPVSEMMAKGEKIIANIIAGQSEPLRFIPPEITLRHPFKAIATSMNEGTVARIGQLLDGGNDAIDRIL